MFTLSPNLSNYFDIESKLISLGHLAGQLGGFVGQSESVKKAVENAIIAKINSHDDLKKLYSPYVTKLSESVKSVDQAVDTVKISELSKLVTPEIQRLEDQLKQPNNHLNNLPSSPTPSADPDKLQSKLDALKEVEKLCEFLTNRNNASNDPKKLLDNLCSGIETFLGFDSDTKGYTGQGIVYSDLDRMCDGVMGFLSGVLGAVKNENEVTTYDNYITEDNKKLNEVLKLVDSKIGSGRAGLVEAVGAVKRWLEGYGNKLDEKNSEVITALVKLNDTSIIDKSSKINSSNELNVQLTAWTTAINSLKQEVRKIETERINLLDTKLSNKMNGEMTPIKKVLEHLRESSNNKKFVSQVKAVDDELGKQQTELVQQIDLKSHKLRDTLHNEFEKINSTVESLIRSKAEKVSTIRAAIDMSRDAVERELGDYREGSNKKVIGYFKEIKVAIEEFVKGDVDTLFTTNIKTVQDYVAGLGDFVKHDLEKLRTTINNKLAEHATAYVKKATIAIEELEQAYKEKLWDMKLDVEKVDPAIEKLCSAIGTDGAVCKKTIKEAVNKISGEAVKLLNGHNNNREGLGGIASAVEAYGKNFTKQHFENKVLGGWIESILIKDKKIDQHIQQSQRDYKLANKFNIGFDNVDAIRRQIIAAIKSEFNAEIGKVNLIIDERDDSKTVLQKVVSCINEFVRGLDAKLLSEVITDVAEKIAKNVERNILQSAHYKPLEISNPNLGIAVEYTLPALYATARQAANMVEILLNDCKFKNVDEARILAGELSKNLIGAPASDLDKAIHAVKTHVNKMTKDSAASGRIIVNLEKKYNFNYRKNVLTTAIRTGVDLTDDLVSKVREAFGQKGGGWDLAAKIGEDLSHLMPSLYAANTALTNAAKFIDSHISGLKTIPSTVVSKTSDAVELLNKLKETLKWQLNNIAVTVRDANETLDTAIEKLKTAVLSSRQALQGAITSVQNDLTESVKKSIEILTQEVRSLFAKGHEADLAALRKLVDTQLGNIFTIIQEDRNTAIKGMLQKIKDGFMVPIEDFYPRASPPPKSLEQKKLHELAERVKQSFANFFDALRTQKGFTFDFDKISSPNDALNKLLKDLADSQHFDHGFTKNLQRLKYRLGQFTPEKFGDGESPSVLEALRRGYPALVGELEKAYVNVYDGADSIVWSQKTNNKDYPSEDSAKCAKVCLSLLSILYSEFKTILKYCVARCKSDQINMNTELGKYFATQGYKVTEDGKKHWELQDSKGMIGLFICKRMFGKDEHHLYYIDKSKQNALDTLHDCLQIYYQVCHVATFSARKRPCNIFEMLCWVSGLPCNNVYQDMLDDAISELFVDPSKQPEDADGIPVTYISDEPLAAYPQNIAMDDTQRAVKRLCSRSHDILTTIAGTGDAYSMYAVDYSTNSLNFHYPSRGEDCLQMLLDILRRLLPSLKFLHTQCGLSATYHGWSGCQYGRGVKHSNWQCREHPAEESTDCLPRSPLMSYLRDCLPGCLPHQLVSAGCKSECKTCPKSLPGAPCITPLGFRGFSGYTKTGKDICNVLTKFFDNSNINMLFGLLPKPPSTLPEHFQFALTLSSMLDHGKSASDDVSLAFETKTKALSIELYKETSKLTGALQNAYRNQTGHNSSGHSKSTEADLWSLSRESCNLPHDRDIHCAPYLCSTSSDAYTYLAKKHADLYLSWAVYLPWTFYSYLKSLLDAFQQIDCGGSGCTKCSCKPGKHGVEYSCKCNALISCRGVMTTFYQYGFTFGDAKTLYGPDRKYCLSFNTQLSNLLKSQYFTKLFEECDNFIWTIREPFTYMVLALWSLSLFYLICVMVGRLDVLHIRSHLRIPSSHKITAQSLLAAAQVGRLAKISYLQP
ncbi:hypothetical protein, conserved [Babesia bigemina]|uniref:C3H1-type domain-containing protein n=1 Tax=Babesia bigemina TaxID=5866 RepID=A0A061BIN5_BABBI|nr:hypothetical protein, conserved [Babesia bigemina]CDR71377.1 hypothetical protein, conserved [Babesia bigemina]|eukprot:XP_012770327.1 hypothetical protein, conserved [Babesia bigemina]